MTMEVEMDIHHDKIFYGLFLKSGKNFKKNSPAVSIFLNENQSPK
jgi:hypothetical protein